MQETAADANGNLETSREREVALLLVVRKRSQNLQNSQKRAHLRPEAKTAKRLEISGWPWAKTTVEMFHISEMPKACKFVGAQRILLYFLEGVGGYPICGYGSRL